MTATLARTKPLIAVAFPEIAVAANDDANEKIEEEDVNDSVDQSSPELIVMTDEESDNEHDENEENEYEDHEEVASRANLEYIGDQVSPTLACLIQVTRFACLSI